MLADRGHSASSVLLFRAGLTGVAGLEPIYSTTTPTLANPVSSLAGADGDHPLPTLNSGAGRGILTELSLRSVGVPVAEGEVFLVWVARVGMVVVLGECSQDPVPIHLRKIWINPDSLAYP